MNTFEIQNQLFAQQAAQTHYEFVQQQLRNMPHGTDNASAEARHYEAVAQMKAAHEARVAKMEADYQERVVAQRRAFEARRDANRATHEQRMVALTRQLDSSLEGVSTLDDVKAYFNRR